MYLTSLFVIRSLRFVATVSLLSFCLAAHADHGGPVHIQLNLDVPATSSTGNYTATWDAGPFTEQLQQKKDAGSYSTIYTGNNTSHAISVSVSGTYTYYLRWEFCFLGECDWHASYSDSIVVTIDPPPPTPGLITGPSLDEDGTFDLDWGSSTGATSYPLERRISGGAWSEIQDTSSPSRSESGLSENTWEYRVQACNTGGCSAWTTTKTVIVATATAETPPTPVMAQDPGQSTESDETGTTNGTFRVDESGAATYTIPIIAAAGTAGVAPQISLRYSSNRSNGIAGVGWSISGLSAISRCRQTFDQDKNPLPITWSSDDRFCLDGQRLLLYPAVGQTFGADGSTYRTEIDTGAIVTLKGNVSGEPDYFEVQRKDGSVSSYGKADGDTDESATHGDGPGKTLTWAIRKFEDNVGNPIWFSYVDGGAGHRIDEINWAYGNADGPAGSYARLEFNYTTRSDQQGSYVSGSAFVNSSVLSEIVSSNKVGSVFEIIRQYHLNYNEGISTDDTLSRLTSVEECVGSVCLPKTIFDWKAPSTSASLTHLDTFTMSSPNDLVEYQLADINGDSHADLVWLEDSVANAKMNYAFFDGDAYTRQPFVSGLDYYNLPNGGEKLTPIDYNLDGRTDVAYWDDVASYWKIILSVPQNDGTWRLDSDTHTVPIDSEYASFVDVNSDGATDAIWVVADGLGPRQLKLSLLTKSSSEPISSPDYYYFEPAKDVGVPSSATEGLIQAVTSDLNGDGRAGVVIGMDTPYCDWEFQPPDCDPPKYAYTLNIDSPEDLNPGYTTYANLNTAGPVQATEHVRTSGVLTADFNRDGLSDFFYPVFDDPDTNTSQYHLAINKGDGTFTVTEHYQYSMDFESITRPHILDWNGDGYPDLLWKEATGGGTIQVRYWNPSLGIHGGLDPTQTATTVTSDNWDEWVMFPDLNGDGVADMVTINTEFAHGRVKAYTRQVGSTIADRAINRIKKITNGLGAEISVTYEPISDSDHYDRLEIDTLVGTGQHCISQPGGEEFCFDGPVEVFDIDGFYSTLNGEWEVPDGAQALSKTSPVLEVSSPLYVVTDVVGSAPTAGATHGSVNSNATRSTSYRYREAKLQAAGRGFLGFEQRIVIDNQTGFETTTRYRQDWPFTGKPIGTTTTTSAGHLLGKTTQDWEIIEWDANLDATVQQEGTAEIGSIHVFQTGSEDKTYALKANGSAPGSHLSTTSTVTLPDDEGNADDITVTVVDEINGGGVLQTVLTDNEFDGANFPLWRGRLISTTVTTTRPALGGAGMTRKSEFDYYPVGNPHAGMLWKERILDEDLVSILRETVHSYDDFGNRDRSAVSGDGTTRCDVDVVVNDTITGRYIDKTYDCLGHWISEVPAGTRNKFGAPESIDRIIDATNGSSRVTTNLYYGALGREYFRASEDGSFTSTYLSPTQGNCPSGTAYRVTISVAGGGSGEVCYDVLARETRSLRLGFDGQWDATDAEFDNLGRVRHQSEPFDLGGTKYWNTMSYDLLGRIWQVNHPDASTTTTAYLDFTTTVTNALSQTHIEKRNALGEVVTATDNLSGTVDFEYDHYGNLHKARVNGDSSPETVTLFDALGRKQSMDDPDKGHWEYDYNAFDELSEQRNANCDPLNPANCQFSRMTYDDLGRIKTRIDVTESDNPIDPQNPEGNTTWTYDTAPNGLGQLNNVHDQVSGYTQSVLYDAFGRADHVTTSFGTANYQESHTFDQYGRLFQSFDAAGATSGTKNQYNAYGFLENIADAMIVAGVPRTVYRKIVAMNVRGQVTEEKLGINIEGTPTVTTTMDHELETGRLTDIDSVNTAGQGEVLQDLEYSWNAIGQLDWRKDHSGVTTKTESFSYDNLNRVLTSSVTGQPLQSFTYDAIGNLKTRTGVDGTYEYGVTAGPHAVTKINGLDWTYDAKGNNLTSPGRAISYYTFDKPSTIDKGGHVTSFVYAPDRSRYKRVDSNSEVTTTHYVGNVEVVYRDGGVTEYKRYIGGVALDIQYSSGGSEILYTLKDHLGSTDALIDSSGTNIEPMSFGAWGQRREPSDWQELDGNGETIDLGPNFDIHDPPTKTTKGFTGHEMLDATGVIHMNGRIYDPFIGRFLQADPFVQFPTDSQSHNRYSYLLNNPLNETDPSGYYAGETGVVVFSWLRSMMYFAEYIRDDIDQVVATPNESFSVSAISDLAFSASPTLDGFVDVSGQNRNWQSGQDVSSKTVGSTYSTMSDGKYTNAGASDAFAFTVEPSQTHEQKISSSDGHISIYFSYQDSRLVLVVNAILENGVLNLHRDGGKGSLPVGIYDIQLTLDSSVPAFRTPSAGEILINPDVLSKVSEYLASSMGHEFVHVGDWTRKRIRAGDADSYWDTEIRGYDWEIRHVPDIYPKSKFPDAQRRVEVRNLEKLKREAHLKIYGR